jgi:hypothetical protein
MRLPPPHRLPPYEPLASGLESLSTPSCFPDTPLCSLPGSSFLELPLPSLHSPLPLFPCRIRISFLSSRLDSTPAPQMPRKKVLKVLLQVCGMRRDAGRKQFSVKQKCLLRHSDYFHVRRLDCMSPATRTYI